MVDQEVIHKLKLLSGRQREVLKLFCEGNEYLTIGEILFIEENTVKTHMGNIYIKLGLDQLNKPARKMTIYQIYCPAVHEFALTLQREEPVKPKSVKPKLVKPKPVESEPVKPVPVEPEPVESEPVESEPEPVPDEVIDMVNEDEHALVVVNQEIGTSPPIHQPRNRRSPRILKWLFLIILLALLIFGGIKVFEWVRGLLVNTPTITIPSGSVQQPGSQVIPTNAASQIVSTSPSQNSASSPTQIPRSTISLPFSDDFNSGLRSEWKPLNGTWVTANGKLTAIQPNNELYLLMLADPTWTNYRVTVDVTISHYGAASEGEFAIGVRALNTQSKFLGFFVDSLERGGWALLGSWHGDMEYIVGQTKVGTIPESARYEVEVNGNDFVVRVNGREFQRFNMPGYERGGILLGVECWEESTCPTFDNLSIENIN